MAGPVGCADYGRLSTYCQICGLPVQHDHDVAAEGYFHIWRGDGDDESDPAFAFGPEHAWLRDAVGLRLDDADPDVIIEGLVHDGMFEGSGSDDFVIDGVDDRAALHRSCWGLAGQPDTWEPLSDLQPPAAEARYRQQLFEFAAFATDGRGWMLSTPALIRPTAAATGSASRNCPQIADAETLRSRLELRVPSARIARRLSTSGQSPT